MNTWSWVVLAGVLSYATKLVGYLVPERLLQNPRMARVAATLTIGLLASLTVVNTFTSGERLVVDARLGSLLVAAIALALRAPFLVVVVAGALAAAVLRAFLPC